MRKEGTRGRAENSQIPALAGKSPESSQALAFPAHAFLHAQAEQQVHPRALGSWGAPGPPLRGHRTACPSPTGPCGAQEGPQIPVGSRNHPVSTTQGPRQCCRTAHPEGSQGKGIPPPQSPSGLPALQPRHGSICSLASITPVGNAPGSRTHPVSPCSSKGLCPGTEEEGPGPPARKDRGTVDRHCPSTRGTRLLIASAASSREPVPGHDRTPGRARDKFSWRPGCLCRELTP